MTEVVALGPDDWRVTRELRLAALLDSPEAFGGTYEHAVARSEEQWRGWPADGQVFAAVEGAVPVGMVCGWRPAGSRNTALIGMWVAPRARGGGAAGLLIEAVVAWAIGNGSAAVDLTVYEMNARAHRAYLKYGFGDIGPSADHPGAVDMRMALRGR